MVCTTADSKIVQERPVRPETVVLMATLVNPVMSVMSEITVKMEMKVLKET